MKYFRTGDVEPGPEIDVLVDELAATEQRFLARFQHGWIWVDSLVKLEQRDKTPLTWKFATAADLAPTIELRELTEAERVEWIGRWTADSGAPGQDVDVLIDERPDARYPYLARTGQGWIWSRSKHALGSRDWQPMAWRAALAMADVVVPTVRRLTKAERTVWEAS